MNHQEHPSEPDLSPWRWSSPAPPAASKVMMNLVTGVFVEGAQRIAREEKNQAAVSDGENAMKIVMENAMNIWMMRMGTPHFICGYFTG